MENITLDELITVLNGKIRNYKGNLTINGISTDTRTIKNGSLFVALKGEKFNGNEFVDKASENGAICAVVSENINCNIPYIIVEDTLLALGKIANYYRKKFNIPIIGVTGSVGKTSTKEAIAYVLETKLNVHKTEKNFNNEIGLPQTLFNLNKEHEVSVIELGMNNFHEIERLSKISKPDIGVITNIGTAHIENLGDKEGIMRAKMEITSCFNKDNILIINGDDEYLAKIKKRPYKVIKVSINNKGDYNAYDIKDLGENGSQFKIIFKGREEIIKINAPGAYNIYNALISIVIGEILNIDINDIKKGIENYTPSGMRMNIINLNSGVRVIADCYNANPESMKASINVLKSFKGNRRIAVLGDMFELGKYSEKGHREVGLEIKDKADILVTIGKDSKYIFDEAKDYIECKHFETKKEAEEYLSGIIQDGDIILVKASRGMEMETIIDYITNALEGRK